MKRPKLTTRLRARLLRLGVGLSVLMMIWSCNAPFIPVPPPAQAGFAAMQVPDGNGGEKTVWITSGLVAVNASKVFVFNQALGSGVITRPNADGSYQAPPLDGTRGDRISIYYEDHAGEQSPTACLLLQEGPQAPTCP
jgi:hypothetical protein